MLDAALDVFDGPDAQSMTTEHIADLADVSVATVYNLVGTREELLIALIDRLLEDLVDETRSATPADDPIGALGQLIGRSVDVLVRRPHAYRQVVLQLCASATGHLHTRLNPSMAAAAAFERAQQLGVIRDDLDPRALGLQVYLSYNGALLRWAAGGLTDRAFRAAALHGLHTVVAAGATSHWRSAKLADLRAVGGKLRT